MVGDSLSARRSLLWRDAVWVGTWTASVTLVGPAPAGSVDGVRVAVAPVGKPVTISATAPGKVGPLEGPTFRI